MLTKPDGELAILLARRAIEECLKKGIKLMPDNLPKVFNENRGVFVTLNTRKTPYLNTGTVQGIEKRKELRGCIGRPYPIMPLGEAIIISAINAASDDPRFHPVKPEEIDGLIIEVTVLTVPKRISAKPRDLPDKIVIGRDGLIVATGRCSGLLLPQVAVEHGFDCTEFLCQTCMKAGLMPDAWLNGAEVYSFEGQIFEELEPGGEVREKDIKCDE